VQVALPPALRESIFLSNVVQDSRLGRYEKYNSMARILRIFIVQQVQLPAFFRKSTLAISHIFAIHVRMPEHISTVTCPDCSGIIHAVTVDQSFDWRQSWLTVTVSPADRERSLRQLALRRLRRAMNWPARPRDTGRRNPIRRIEVESSVRAVVYAQIPTRSLGHRPAAPGYLAQEPRGNR
jgi:hypothetical protein